MKKLISFPTLILFLLIGCLISCKTDLGEMPEFSIRKSDQTKVNISEFTDGKTSLIIHFDADCKGCQDEAQAIVDHLDELGDVKIVFASVQEFDKIDLFDTYFKLSEKSNIVVGQDYSNTIPTHFKTISTPLIALVDKDGDVRKVITGEIEIAELNALINEIN